MQCFSHVKQIDIWGAFSASYVFYVIFKIVLNDWNIILKGKSTREEILKSLENYYGIFEGSKALIFVAFLENLQIPRYIYDKSST